MKIVITFCSYALLVLSFLSCSNTSKKQKVLLVGIDGLQLEKIAEANTPNLDKLTIAKAYCGGKSGTVTEQKTSSGPSWTTILTGVWLNEHSVKNNDTVNKSKAKSIFQRIKEYDSKLETASISTWAPIHDFFRYQLQYIDHKHRGGTDDDSVREAIKVIDNHDPDFMFVHLDEVDGAGHKYGFGETYNKAIEAADTRLGKIIIALEQRAQNHTDEDWLIVVTTDHGRGEGGFSHGDQTEREKTIFIAVNDVNTKKIDKYKPKNEKSIYEHLPQTAIVPIVLDHYGIDYN